MVETMIVVFRNDDVLEAEFLSLCYALFDTTYRTNLTAESYFASHAPPLLYRRIHIAAQYRSQHTQVHRRVSNPQSSGNIQEHILLHQLEANPLFHHRQKHVQSSLVKPRCRTLRCSICSRTHQSLRFYQERTDALNGCTNGYTRKSVMILCKKQLRWIAHLSQSSLQHLVDTQFRSTSESVLDAAQDAIHIMLVTLKLDNGIHNMLQYLRSRQGSLLIDMAYQDNRNATGLGKAEKMGCTLTDL